MSNSQRHPRPRIHPLLRFHAKNPNFFADVAAQQAELIALQAENAALRTDNTALRAENTTLWSMITILQAELIALQHTMKLAVERILTLYRRLHHQLRPGRWDEV